MRRSGSAAPHSNWSPTVNADRYSPPIASLRKPPDRHRQRARDDRRRQITHRRFALVRHDLHPVIRRCQNAMHFIERHVLRQLDGQRLRVAAHRADTHAQAVDRHRSRLAHRRLAEDLVGFSAALPLFLRHPVAEILVDPRNQRAGERHAEVVGRHARRCSSRRTRGGRCRESPTTDSPDRPSPRRGARPSGCSSSRMFCAPAPEAA